MEAQSQSPGGTMEPSAVALRLLRMGGLSSAEASNLVAYLSGIQPRDGGWTLREIQRLLFVGYLVDAGRLKS
jgi:hypothetical protein